MEVTDVLIGSTSVVVETTGDEYKYSLSDSETVEAPVFSIPDVVKTALEEQGLEVVNSFPKTIKRYAHDEATGYDFEQVADELGLDEDDSIVRTVAGATYEIEITIEIREDGECYATHYDGSELKEPKKLY